MNKIITIGREFGSGGRELGRRLSEILGFAYYDQEIVVEIAKRTDLSEKYVQQILEHRPILSYPISTGISFRSTLTPVVDQCQAIFQEQFKIIKEMAESSDCVIVGRCADYILHDDKPLRIFVYADLQSKIERCRKKSGEHENMSDAELRRHIAEVDKNRARYYEFYTGQTWGDRMNYDLCINTTNQDIKEVSAAVARLFE